MICVRHSNRSVLKGGMGGILQTGSSLCPFLRMAHQGRGREEGQEHGMNNATFPSKRHSHVQQCEQPTSLWPFTGVLKHGAAAACPALPCRLSPLHISCSITLPCLPPPSPPTDGSLVVDWLSNHIHDATQGATTHWDLQGKREGGFRVRAAALACLVVIPITSL